MSPRGRWRRLDLEFCLLDEILACTERLLPGTGNDSDAEAGLFVEPGENSFRFPVRVGGDGVHGILAVNGYEEDVRGRVG